MKLINQAQCHVELIKYISCVIVFEVVRNSRKGKRSNLDGYTVPIKKNI